MGNERQIDRLNSMVKCKLAPSPIHGIGVFAIRDIGKGQKLWADIFPQFYSLPYSNFGKLFPEVRDLLLERWPGIAGGQTIIEGTRFAYPDTLLQAYMNHQDDPSYDAFLDIARRDIKAGEEITENYRLILGWQIAHTWLVETKPQENEEVKSVKGRKGGKKTKNMV